MKKIAKKMVVVPKKMAIIHTKDCKYHPDNIKKNQSIDKLKYS